MKFCRIWHRLEKSFIRPNWRRRPLMMSKVTILGWRVRILGSLRISICEQYKNIFGWSEPFFILFIIIIS